MPKIKSTAAILLIPLLASPISTIAAGSAEIETARICQQVAAIAGAERDVPLSVLLAITLTETGRKRQKEFLPWPWTVNMEGKGIWFQNRAEALSYVEKHFQSGARSFDVGCFQINYKWHGQHFASIKAMFDPLTNARYAARHLSDLHREFGDWEKAAGAYHSRTPKYARRYKKRFARIRAGLDTVMLAALAKPQVTQSQTNAYPLLVKTTKQALPGSLFVSAGSHGSLLRKPSGGLF